jgi:hypothetical protein
VSVAERRFESSHDSTCVAQSKSVRGGWAHEQIRSYIPENPSSDLLDEIASIFQESPFKLGYHEIRKLYFFPLTEVELIIF